MLFFLKFSTPSASRDILRSRDYLKVPQKHILFLFIYSDGHGLSEVGIAIGFRVDARYLPSIVTGMLVDKVGRTWWKGDFFCIKK